MALEINTPRHDWYQRHYHVRLPRMAESKAYLNSNFFDLTGPPPAVPVGWNFGLRTGLGASGASGFNHPMRGGEVYGVINPSTFSGKPVAGIVASASNASIFVYFSQPGEQLPGMGTVTVTAQGFGGSVTALWQSGNLRYGATSQTFKDFLLANVGNVVGITFVASAL